MAGKLVSKNVGKAATSRPRHAYRLTAAGKEEARTAWKPQLSAEVPTADLDSILRIADMAAHYRADKAKIRTFLRRASEARSLLAQQAALEIEGARGLSYSKMRTRCDASRLAAEAKVLLRLAEQFRPKGPKGVVEGQQALGIGE